MQKYQKGIIFPAVMIIIVLAVLIAGGVLAYPYVQSYIQKALQKAEPPEREIPQDQIAGWKTFRDTEYNLFEFEYPAEGMNILESPVTDVCYIGDNSTTCTAYSTTYWGDNLPYNGLYVSLIYSPLNDKVIHKYDGSVIIGQIVDTTKQISIGGKQGYEYDLVSSTNYKIHGIIIPIDENSFLEISENSKNPKIKAGDWAEIISTFKFTK